MHVTCVAKVIMNWFVCIVLPHLKINVLFYIDMVKFFWGFKSENPHMCMTPFPPKCMHEQIFFRMNPYTTLLRVERVLETRKRKEREKKKNYRLHEQR